MLSTYAKNLMLTGLVNGNSFYLAVLTSEDTADEVSTGRTIITFSSPDEGALVGATEDGVEILSGTTVAAVAIYDDETDGNHIATITLDTSETYSNDGTFSLSDLTISL